MCDDDGMEKNEMKRKERGVRRKGGRRERKGG